MNLSAQGAGASPAAPAVLTPAEAAAFAARLGAVMDALLQILEQETELVRAGDLVGAAKLEPEKADLSRQYLAGSARIKSSLSSLRQAAPEAVAELRRRHESFEQRLRANLTVLATAHAVSESIMRGVSTEMARKATPAGYGAGGRAAAPSNAARQPLTVSRVL